MENEILISVIIPIYNGEKYLERCLKGIESQTYGHQNFEVVFIDDASTDDSDILIHNFICKNKDIHFNYIRLRENGGIAHAKTMGIYNAKGKYIIFHDQDDWMESDCLEILAKAAIESKADRIVASYREVDISGKTLRVVSYEKNFSKWFCTALHGVLFRKEIFVNNNIIIPNFSQMEDAYLNANFALYTENNLYLENIVHNYLIRTNSTSGAKNNNNNWNAVTLFNSALECYVPLYQKTNCLDDKNRIEYMVVKQFFWYLLHNNRYSKYEDALAQYKILKKLLEANFKNYKHNPYICLMKKNGDRASGQKTMYLLTLCERLKLFPFILKMFIFISKKKYI